MYTTSCVLLVLTIWKNTILGEKQGDTNTGSWGSESPFSARCYRQRASSSNSRSDLCAKRMATTEVKNRVVSHSSGPRGEECIPHLCCATIPGSPNLLHEPTRMSTRAAEARNSMRSIAQRCGMQRFRRAARHSSHTQRTGRDSGPRKPRAALWKTQENHCTGKLP